MKTIPLFNKILKKETQDFVGINLGNYFIKGLVTTAGRVTDYFIKERKDLSGTLRQIWQEKNITTPKVKISLKDHSTLVRYFNFPKLDRSKIKQTLFYELNKHIPFSPEEVYFDFSILEENPANMFLLLAVARKELINNTIDIFEKEKKEILDISLDSVCLVNVFLNYYKEERKINTSILDMGHGFSTLTVLRKGVPFITRDLMFGTKDVLSIISHIKNIPVEAVEKWVNLAENHKEFLELSQDNITALCREVKSSFDYFEVNKGERIEKLFLTGGLSSVSGIDALFKEHLESEVLFLDNLLNLKSAISAEKFGVLKNTFAVASGLVL